MTDQNKFVPDVAEALRVLLLPPAPHREEGGGGEEIWQVSSKRNRGRGGGFISGAAADESDRADLQSEFHRDEVLRGRRRGDAVSSPHVLLFCSGEDR